MKMLTILIMSGLLIGCASGNYMEEKSRPLGIPMSDAKLAEARTFCNERNMNYRVTEWSGNNLPRNVQCVPKPEERAIDQTIEVKGDDGSRVWIINGVPHRVR